MTIDIDDPEAAARAWYREARTVSSPDLLDDICERGIEQALRISDSETQQRLCDKFQSLRDTRPT